MNELHPKVIKHRLIKYLKKSKDWISFHALLNLSDFPKEGGKNYEYVIDLLEEWKHEGKVLYFQTNVHTGLGYYAIGLYKVTDKL